MSTSSSALYTTSLFLPNTNEKIHGFTYEEWLAKWWQSYYYSTRQRTKEPVYMVPGKIMEDPKEGKIKQRYVVIKEDRPILFAILNWLAVDPDDNRTEEDMVTETKARIDVVATNKQQFTIDNDAYKIKNQMDVSSMASRVRSTFFELKGHKCVTEGYWLFLRPFFFGRGDYSIHSFGTCSMGAIQVEIDYHVFIR